jgi:hypothetical protein
MHYCSTTSATAAQSVNTLTQDTAAMIHNSLAVASRRMATQQHRAVAAANRFVRSSYKFAPHGRRSMGTITKGVDFDTIAREWRCKWSKDNDMQSLQDAQKALENILSDLKGTAGCKSVHRVVCSGELDFKVCVWSTVVVVCLFLVLHSSSIFWMTR